MNIECTTISTNVRISTTNSIMCTYRATPKYQPALEKARRVETEKAPQAVPSLEILPRET
jgi:hypothetical protein